MPGVVFLIVVPTANFERELIYGNNQDLLAGHKNTANIPPGPVVPGIPTSAAALLATTAGGMSGGGGIGVGNNNLNINLPENNNAVLRLEVELRDKNAPKYRRAIGVGAPRGGRGAGFRGNANNRPTAAATVGGGVAGVGGGNTAVNNGNNVNTIMDLKGNAIVPLEKVLEELLVKLEIEHVTWTTSKKGYFHHVVFPLQSGEPCETTLHCLTELGIGTKLNSSVSVLPCSVSYDALTVADEYR
ncbi:hypothetical protein DOY81_011750 [Sarcophaga bullata]|nr:hypothetical protein DOY81_011750 [Sarcophaga bullata]